MRGVLLLAIVFGVVGLIIGYLIFARAPVTGDLIAISDLIQQPQSLLGEIVSELSQFGEMRRNILLSGGGGLIVGIFLGVVVTRK